MNTTGNGNTQETKWINSHSSNINIGIESGVTDNKNIQSSQSNNKYQFAHFASNKEMEEGIERILGDNSFA